MVVKTMVGVTKAKVYKTDNRHYIYLPTDLIKDSTFPFDLMKDKLQIRTDGDRLVIEKLK